MFLRLIVTLGWLSGSLTSPITSSRQEKRHHEILKDPSTAAADRIIAINEDADESPDLFEGDIELTPDEVSLLSSQTFDDVTKRNAHLHRQGLWRARTIPYEIDTVLVNKGFKDSIASAVQAFHNGTCLRWVKRSNEKNWILFKHGQACKSRVGKTWLTEGAQGITLSDGCNRSGTIIHEMMHAIGFWHEQSRPDRDQHVEVMWENIEQGQEHEFAKYGHDMIDTLGVAYDYESVMHYGRQSFSKNKKATIQALGDPTRGLGRTDGLSSLDIMKINLLYDCKRATGGWTSWSRFTPCDRQLCEKYRQRFCTSKDPSSCPGAQIEIHQCSDQECNAPIDGHWGRWGSWSACSVSCGQGSHTRTRRCDDPAPSHGGKPCIGLNKGRQACDDGSCALGIYDCDFEKSELCNWLPKQTEYKLKWQRTQGVTPSSDTGPQGDHTSGSGHYLFVESSHAKLGEQAIIISPEIPPDTRQCVHFWYSMHGADMGRLDLLVYDEVAGSGQSLWSKEGEQGMDWGEGKVEIAPGGHVYKVGFQATISVERAYRSDFALDDIKIEPCKRPPTKAKPPTTTTSKATAPISDPMTTTTPTTTKATTPTTTKATASTTTDATASTQTAAEANTFLSTQKTDATTSQSTSTTEATKSQTTKATTTLSTSTTKATTTPSTSTTKATTSTAVEATTTPAATETAPPTTTESWSTNKATTIPTIIDDFCDFSTKKCDWRNDYTNPHSPDKYVFDWWRTNKPTTSANTGPAADHTTGSGYYIYLEGSYPYQQGDKGRLVSRRYPRRPAICLKFWYHMYGKEMGSLRVYVKNEAGVYKLWEIDGNQGNEWHEASIMFGSESPFEIMIEGERGTGYTSDIALDDLRVKEGACQIVWFP